MRIVPYLFSQFLWAAVFALPMIAVLKYGTTTVTKDFFSINDEQEWNSSSDPFWMMHATDIHLAAKKPKSYNTTYKSLNKSISILNPDKIIFTGDLVDNYVVDSFRPFVKQVKEDWDLYDKLLTELNLKNDERLVQVAGNHDFYDLLDYNSKSHYANGVIYNKTTFLHNRIPLNISNDKASLLTMNPYRFPAPPLRLTWFTTPSKSDLQKIFNEITDNKDRIQVLVTHHPAYMWFPNTGTDSSSSYSEFLKLTENVRLILSGHLHPKTPLFFHHGDALEVVGTPLFRYPNKVGLVTFDNRRCVYHSINLSSKHIAVMTAPAPSAQASGLDDFSQKKTEIRALYFGKTPGNLTVEGDVTGQLNCSREVKPGVWLCSKPLHLQAGNYVLRKSGDWEGNVTFSIGSTISGFVEKPVRDEASISYTFLYAWFAAVAIVLTLPIPYKGVGEKFDSWVSGKSQESQWAFSIFCGLLAVHSRLMKAPLFVKLSAFGATAWALLLPCSFFAVEGRPAMLWAWGTAANGDVRFTFEGMEFVVFYLLYAVFPFVLLAATISFTRGRSFLILIDAAVCAAGLYGCGYKAYTLADWFGRGFGATAPMFVFVPVALLCVNILGFVKVRKAREEEYAGISNVSLNA